MPSAPGKTRRNRESVPPSDRAAQKWTGERRRKTRQNADRCSRPARYRKSWRSSRRPPATGNQPQRTASADRCPEPGISRWRGPRTVARAGSRAQGRFRAVAARPGARIVGRFFIRTPPPAQGCPGHANRYSSCFFARSRLTISTKFSAYFGVWGVTKLKHHIRGWPSEQMPIWQGFPHPIPRLKELVF